MGTLNFNTAFPGSAGTIPTVLASGGTANFGTNPLNATTLTITFGTLTSTADITVSGLTTIQGGTISRLGECECQLRDPGLTRPGLPFFWTAAR